MSVPEQLNPFNSQTANGVTTVFPYTYLILDDEDLTLIIDGVVQTTGYTVSGVGNPAGGNITITPAPANGVIVASYLNPKIRRETDYQQYGDWTADVVNADFDRIWLTLQAVARNVRNALKVSDEDIANGVDPTLPAPEGGKAIAWSADGKSLINIELSTGTSMVDLSADSGSALMGFIQAGTGTVSRTVQSKAREIISVSDYASVTDGLANITTRGAIIVPRGASVTPAGATGKDAAYLFIDGGDADNVLQFDGTRGGLYSDYDCKANLMLVAHIDADQSAVSGGGFRDGLFLNVIDDDTVNYTAIGNKVTHGLRSFVQGKHNGTAYQSIYKDLVGAYFSAAGNVQWSARGVSAITSDAWQFGIGIASNEFAINNPASGAGGQGQSVSGAAIDAIVRFDYADEDGTHFAYGAVIENSGKRITAGLMLFSNTSRGYSGHFKHLIYAADAITTGSAIVMPQSSSGDVGTIIAYDSNDYSYFDRTNNRFNWIIGGALSASMTANGVSIGSATTTGTRLFIEASTTALSHIRMYQGVAPSSPADGDLWYNGTNLKFQNGATLRTISWV